jgi:putative protein kinase ArgK-like GTPase of G3E family
MLKHLAELDEQSSADEMQTSSLDLLSASSVATVNRTDRAAAKTALAALKQRGELVEGPDQHPNAGVRPAENEE